VADWYDEVYCDRTRYGLRLKERLYDGRSDYQHIEVVDSLEWGRTLVLDGIFMTSIGDEHYYHEMIVHPALCTARSIGRILLIGGGDGGTAREVLRYTEVEQVVMVEIDGQVVDVCREYLPELGGGAWKDPRLSLRIEDAVAYVKEAHEEPYDVILLDGTDPVGPGKGLFDQEFYEAVRRMLRPAGVFVLQSESPILTNDVFFEIQATLRRVFPSVHPYFGPAPLYCAGSWSWTLAGDDTDPMRLNETRLAALGDDLRYYNADIHRGAFAQPNEVRARLQREARR